MMSGREKTPLETPGSSRPNPGESQPPLSSRPNPGESQGESRDPYIPHGNAGAVIAEIEALLTSKGQRRYGLHDVSQLQHALQAATLAEAQGEPAALIAAALLHDIGHMTHELGENPAESGIDDQHEQHGYAYLVRYFGPDVTEPVRLHVAAKRYLCATEPGYFNELSPDSVLSLRLQGGPMSLEEVAAFRALPHASAAVRLRRFDEAAKVKDLPTPPVGHFLQYVEASLQRSA